MRLAFASLPIVIATSSLLVATPALGQEEIDRAATLEQLEHMERPDDPPLPPAQPVPGAAPSAPVRFGPFVHTQVNVDAQGANIPGDAGNAPSVAVGPTDPLFLCIGWRQFDNVASNFRQAGVGYSTDG